MSVARRGGSSSSSLATRPEWVGNGTALVMDRGDQSMIHLTASAQDHVAAYLEYERIVGDADGGKMFTEEEYAEFKANAIAHRANRIYVSWRNMTTGMDCRQVGPSSSCFCGHRFRQHATDNTNKNIFCKTQGCPCTLFSYIPVRGTQDVKCTCKHSYDVHGVTGKRRCKQPGCMCGGFHTSISCSCRDQYGAHQTVFETREERQAAGRPVDNLAGGGAGYEAMGGITSFSSLVDGIDRMAVGPSGEPELIGAPPARKALTQEDEFAMYESKYKKGGSAYSAASKPRPTSTNRTTPSSTSSSSSSAVSSGSYGGAPPPTDGGRAYQLFHTSGPHDNMRVCVAVRACVMCLTPLSCVCSFLPSPVPTNSLHQPPPPQQPPHRDHESVHPLHSHHQPEYRDEQQTRQRRQQHQHTTRGRPEPPRQPAHHDSHNHERDQHTDTTMQDIIDRRPEHEVEYTYT